MPWSEVGASAGAEISSPQGSAGDLEEEHHGSKRVCLRVQHQDLTVEHKAASLESPSEVQHTTVGAPAAILESTGATQGAFVATVGSEGITMDKNVSSGVNYATLESSVRLKSMDATLASKLQFSDATLSHDATSQPNDATLGSNGDFLQSIHSSLGSNKVFFDSNDTSVESSARLPSSDATLESNQTLLSNDAKMGSNKATLGANDALLQSIDATLGSNKVFFESNAATLESSNARVKCADAPEEVKGNSIEVSVIIPVYNGAGWLEECLQGVADQDFQGSLEISVFDDASMDNSRAIAESWRERLRMRGVSMVISGHNMGTPRGVGFAKNKAVAQSSGRYLCFQDADDVMMPQRVRLQYEAAVLNPNCIVGCKVRRIPEGSTERYTRWINTLSPEQLLTQVCTSHGPTVVMPTWFCSHHWFQKVGPFDEGGKGVPEDLLWFYQSLRLGGGAIRVDECLLIYRYHEHAATHSVLEETIWKLRVDFLEERVLGRWSSFTIWNAGKQGRKLYRSLTAINQKKVKGFCDVDENKIKKGFYTYEESKFPNIMGTSGLQKVLKTSMCVWYRSVPNPEFQCCTTETPHLLLLCV
ncbi:UDP-GlcNAc:betaGal beta-1,3-N-acetylglucosaminyltransferase-like protein 1 isoform X2 [Silurus meridionalis]|uniref:UDP-GlcNAc:betaGal beta-1,3-N-acetylglucosaminyltransferase-like protein 1 isoform X2 n=1 Tax=Silurus meridionalis TaxID=175797 RepID=UPI001EEC4795|nr:UDP-GlcNAc:betaGal beta-1,3-N-acetylglucosaminyltransferase-like protein 1 isoform X2 [Silurus meridionalis]